MRLAVRVLWVLTLAGCASAPPRGLRELAPARPELAAAADTNDPQAYYDAGLRALETDLARAVDAFYWASRLDPASAEAMYALRVALHAYNLERVRGYLISERYRPSSPLVRQIDSLQEQALLRNPFLYTQFDHQLMSMASQHATRSGYFRPPIVFAGERHYAAWRSYSEGDFARAVRLYAEAIERDSVDYSLHGARSRVFYLMAQYDSALAEMTQMLDLARAAEAKRLAPIYQSKANGHYAIAVIHVARGDLLAGREALQRALGDDVAFYMAHAALGDVHLVLGDTAAALAEHDMAVQLQPRDPALRHRYGVALIGARHYEQALAQLREAIVLNADYAQPYLPLAYALERLARPEEAIAAYESFLARAPRSFREQIAVARGRLVELRRVGDTKP